MVFRFWERCSMKKTLMIRHYVIAQMYRAGNSSIQIMSARELARHFDVAQSTVSLAIKELMDEGYLFSRPGIGNFTNPMRMPVYMDRTMPPLIGLMAGDGRFFYWGESFWRSYRAMVDAILASGWNLRPIELSGPLGVETAHELSDNRIDALIWTGAYRQNEFADELQKLKIPTVTDSPFLAGLNSVTPDYRPQIKMLLQYAIDHDHHQLLIGVPEETCELEIPILREEAALANWPLELEFLHSDLILREEFWKNYFLNHPRVLAVVDHFRCSSDFLPRYAEKFHSKLDLYRHGAGCCDGKTLSFFKGAGFADAITNRLKEVLAGDRNVEHRHVPLDIVTDK